MPGFIGTGKGLVLKVWQPRQLQKVLACSYMSLTGSLNHAFGTSGVTACLSACKLCSCCSDWSYKHACTFALERPQLVMTPSRPGVCFQVRKLLATLRKILCPEKPFYRKPGSCYRGRLRHKKSWKEVSSQGKAQLHTSRPRPCSHINGQPCN